MSLRPRKNVHNKNTLLELFESEPAVVIEKQIEIYKHTPETPSENMYIFTPNTQRLLESFTPKTQRMLAEDFMLDDKKVSMIEEEQEINDFLYKYFENKMIGTFLEKWICCYLRCKCDSKFVKYQNPNMPIIDIRCRNKSHDITLYGPKYYQIKSSELYKSFMGLEYFQLEPNQYIHVGSTRYGKYCHEIKVGDIDKQLLIGYICIKYTYKNDYIINIDGNNSFILCPKIQGISAELNDLPYYSYRSYEPKPIITFDKKLFDIYLFTNIGLNLYNINIYMQFEEHNDIQPIPLVYYKKYLKYKQKYIKLKNDLIKE